MNDETRARRYVLRLAALAQDDGGRSLPVFQVCGDPGPGAPMIVPTQSSAFDMHSRMNS
jgi:hypothetical protein